MAFTHITQTSEDILKYLKDRGFDLDSDDKEFVRKKVYDAIVEAGEYQSNGCDCGQVSCPICTP